MMIGVCEFGADVLDRDGVDRVGSGSGQGDDSSVSLFVTLASNPE